MKKHRACIIDVGPCMDGFVFALWPVTKKIIEDENYVGSHVTRVHLGMESNGNYRLNQKQWLDKLDMKLVVKLLVPNGLEVFETVVFRNPVTKGVIRRCRVSEGRMEL